MGDESSESKKKIMWEQIWGGGKCWWSLARKQNVGRHCLGGGPFRKSLGGPLRSGAPGCISWASTYPPSPQTKFAVELVGAWGRGSHPHSRDGHPCSGGGRGGGFVGESSKSCVAGGEERFGGK